MTTTVTIYESDAGMTLTDTAMLGVEIRVTEVGMTLSDTLSSGEGTLSSKTVTINDALNLYDPSSNRAYYEGLDEPVDLTDGQTVTMPSANLHDPSEITDELVIALHRTVTVDDLLDLTDRAIASGTASPGSTLEEELEDLLSMADDLTVRFGVVGVSGAYQFLPPTVEEGSIGIGPLFGRIKATVGVAVLVTDGVVVERRWPSSEEIDAADRVYLGGHVHYIPADDAAVLEAAGYADNLTPVDVYIDEYRGVY